MNRSALLWGVLLSLCLGSRAQSALPDRFDWRDVGGVNYVSGVRSLRVCDAVFVFAPVAMVESRVMIEMGRQGQPVREVDYSEQYIISCGSGYYGDFSCDPGYPGDTLAHLQEAGVPRESCYLYRAFDEGCPASCPDADVPLTLTKPVSASELHTAPFSVEELMTEILDNGPVAAQFDLYEDFYAYEGGIYRHADGDYTGNTVATIVGWGEDGGVPFWTVKHSWGPYWGEQGYFRIARDGTDNCNFPAQVWTCTVNLNLPEAPPTKAATPGFLLGQNHPNPFNPTTVIPYQVPCDCRVRLRVYDVSGQLVRTLVDGLRPGKGEYEVVWNGCDDAGGKAPAGIYFYRLHAGDLVETRRMVLLK